MKFADKLAHFSKTEHELDKLETSWAKAALFFRTGERMGHCDGERRVSTLVEVHRKLEARRTRFEKGNTFDLLHAVALCAEENLPLPTWLASAFRNAIDGFTKADETTTVDTVPVSLDDVFGSGNLRTNTAQKAHTARRDWAKGIEFRSRVYEVVAADPSIQTIDRAVSVALKGGSFAFQMTRAKELLDLIDKTQHELAGTMLLSEYLAKRRNEPER
jgi:hypothetical protein